MFQFFGDIVSPDDCRTDLLDYSGYATCSSQIIIHDSILLAFIEQHEFYGWGIGAYRQSARISNIRGCSWLWTRDMRLNAAVTDLGVFFSIWITDAGKVLAFQ